MYFAIGCGFDSTGVWPNQLMIRKNWIKFRNKIENKNWNKNEIQACFLLYIYLTELPYISYLHPFLLIDHRAKWSDNICLNIHKLMRMKLVYLSSIYLCLNFLNRCVALTSPLLGHPTNSVFEVYQMLFLFIICVPKAKSLQMIFFLFIFFSSLLFFRPNK